MARSYRVTISDKEGAQRVMELDTPEVTIGRVKGNDVVLPKGNISKRHARVVTKDGKLILVDLKSTNGTYVNGRKLSSPRVLKQPDKVYIGDFTLTVEQGVADRAPSPPPPPAPLRHHGDETSSSRRRMPGVPPPEELGGLAEAAVFSLMARRGDLGHLEKDPAAAERAARRAWEEVSAQGGLPAAVDGEVVVSRAVTEVLGLGPLEDLLADVAVTQIFASGPRSIYVGRGRGLARHDEAFSSVESMTHVLHKLLRSARVETNGAPIVDTRLEDGTHISALLPPIAASGPVFSLRKPTRPITTLQELVEAGALTPRMAAFLRVCVRYRKNIVISASRGADGTSLLRAIASTIEEDERIVAVEEVSQLDLPQRGVASLEVAPMSGERGLGMSELVRAALRLDPDRLIVGDCRGGEALDILQAMVGALDGGLVLVHGYSARDCVSRLEAMTLMGGLDMTALAVREVIASAVDLFVQVSRCADGAPRVTQIAAVSGMEVDLITLQDIFTYRVERAAEGGAPRGRFFATGVVPRFYEELQRRGEQLDVGVFREGT